MNMGGGGIEMDMDLVPISSSRSRSEEVVDSGWAQHYHYQPTYYTTIPSTNNPAFPSLLFSSFTLYSYSTLVPLPIILFNPPQSSLSLVILPLVVHSYAVVIVVLCLYRTTLISPSPPYFTRHLQPTRCLSIDIPFSPPPSLCSCLPRLGIFHLCNPRQ
ncbi:hypothetical protein BU24DRAFT_190579 [Aaosphaeria arxii CBS 175.79]|uniref:Transmembrane protein n=1 Tax=Aaosphaeria arxii CBS 175.79 TaxID=1450172 RepID=A0A6A5XS88_9PLEO|nr:uncharacterized protein BU24DRAFT_190579 [Aaosphaeria arxii CBS 175.79]KAF2016032.1 hypothetical protein BU24DRAFT_190579 [Aaosphaeria arxii CBS 175.79]